MIFPKFRKLEASSQTCYQPQVLKLFSTRAQPNRNRTSLVNKGFIIYDKTPKHGKFSLWDKALIASGLDGSILPAQVANQCKVRFILPTHRVTHIIIITYFMRFYCHTSKI